MSEIMDNLTFEKMHSLTFFIKNEKVIDHLKIKILKADQERLRYLAKK